MTVAGPAGCPVAGGGLDRRRGGPEGHGAASGRTSGAWPGRKAGPVCTPPWAPGLLPGPARPATVPRPIFLGRCRV